MIDKEMVNLDEADAKRRLMTAISPLRGMHEVTIKPVRGTRRQRANAFHWAAVVEPFRQFLSAQGQQYSALECHDFLKLKCLPKNVIDPVTGEVIGVVPGTSHTLAIGEFAEFENRCIEYLEEMFGIICAPPEPIAESRKRDRAA